MAFPPMDYSRFDWKTPKADDPSYYWREALGGEVFQDVCNQNHGEQNLFLGVQVTFTNPISAPDLIARARDAWEALRFDIPTIAATTERDSEGDTFISYRLAKDSAQVKEWSKRTVRLHEGAKDLDEVRYIVGQRRIPEENGDQTFLWIHPKSSTSYGILLHTHHTPFDGGGVQILMNTFLARLSKLIINPSLATTDSLAWGEEHKNLTLPTSAILNSTEQSQGPLYDQSLGGNLVGLGLLARASGFKQRNVEPGPTKRFHVQFSEEDTAKFVAGVRSLGVTVNQYAHAAVNVLTYLDNPNVNEDSVYVCLGLSDSRDRLLPQYAKYPGYALGVIPTSVPASVITSATPQGEKAMVVETAKVLKKEYEGRKVNGALLAVQPQFGDFLFAAIRAGPPPPPNLCPAFAGDGLGEKYLSHSFEGSDGQPVAIVDDYFTSLNMTSPGPFFRVFSWRGSMRLSIDANSAAMPDDVIQGFLKKWEALIRLAL